MWRVIKFNLGVVSERDIVRRLAAQDMQASKVSILEIISPKFRWVEPTTRSRRQFRKC